MKSLRFKDSIAVLLILLFVYTAAGKLLEHERFIFQLRLSPLPQMVHFAPFLSWAAPVVESLIAALLIAGLFIEHMLGKGLWAALILMTAFEIYITAMLLSGKDLPCACGGIIALLSWKGHVVFNGLVILLIMTGLFNSKKIRLRPE